MVWGHAAIDEALAAFDLDLPAAAPPIEWLRPPELQTETVTIHLPRYVVEHFATTIIPSREADLEGWAPELELHVVGDLMLDSFDLG